MGIVAIYNMSCCNREIVAGRFHNPDASAALVSKSYCPHGCKVKKGHTVPMNFVEYRVDSLIPKELLATWKYGKSGDLWHKYDRERKRRIEAAGQGYAPETKAKRGKKNELLS